MVEQYEYKIFFKSHTLPSDWDDFKNNNFFLSKDFLIALEKSTPNNITNFFVGVFKEKELCGKILFQQISFDKLNPFQNTNLVWKKKLNHFFLKRFAKNVLLVGNCMLTGQNAFCFDNHSISVKNQFEVIARAVNFFLKYCKEQKIKIQIRLLKDFDNEINSNIIFEAKKNKYSSHHFQPNMIFGLRQQWKTMENYLDDLNTKYRTQYKRARKKLEGVVFHSLNFEQIIKEEEQIYNLYKTVQTNAAFNTFVLPPNFFSILKQHLGENFLFFGCYWQNKMIGFYTLIDDEKKYHAFFLGYDPLVQKEKMLYLNMCYNMIEKAIEESKETLFLSRTAMEIKSSIGAEAVFMNGLIKHQNPIIQTFFSMLINSFEPKQKWEKRNIFKT